MKLTVTNLESGKEKTVNVSASNLGKLSVKKNPHLHGKEHMKKLNKKRWGKKLVLPTLALLILTSYGVAKADMPARTFEIQNPRVSLGTEYLIEQRGPELGGEVRVVTAYTSEEDQTDSDPFIMASGKMVYDGAIACPRYLEFGTRVEIDGRVYVCEDRMNKRYTDRHDIWFADKQEAMNWGVRTLPVALLK